MLRPGVAQDHSNKQPLYDAATKILDDCVAAEGNIGGSVENLGMTSFFERLFPVEIHLCIRLRNIRQSLTTLTIQILIYRL